MKTSLPKRSQEHLETIHRIRDIIITKARDKVVSIILFGSFARGDFIYDDYIEDNVRYTYASDFDILIVMKNKHDGRHRRSLTLKESIQKQVKKHYLDKISNISIILEPIDHVNRMLEQGQYFFSDIQKEGVLLYQDLEYPLSQPRELSNKEKRNIAQKHFNNWFKKGHNFLKHAAFDLKEGMLNEGAFHLHQTAEHFYNCSLLVLTDYKPKTHKLDILNQLCASQSNDFLKIFPKACFELLNTAYIEARYDSNYKINKEQLEYLIARVERLSQITKKVCMSKIESFEG